MRLLGPAVVVVLFLARCVEMSIRRGSVRRTAMYPGTLWGMLIGGTGVVTASLAEFYLRPHPVGAAWIAVGTSIGLMSFLIRGWAAARLGPFWTMHIAIGEGQPLVREGPYSWVRHPVYLAAALELVGAMVVLKSWWGLAAFWALFAPAVSLRIVLEERAMIAHFGDTYRSYMTTTPALVRLRPPGRNRAP